MEQRVYQSRVNTVDELKVRLIAVWFDFDRTLSTLQLASGESISRHASVQMVDTLNTL